MSLELYPNRAGFYANSIGANVGKRHVLYDMFIEVFNRCTDTTPFIDSLRVSYNRMLEKRLI